MFKITPENGIKFTKFFVVLLFSWPPWPDASKFEKNLFNIFTWIFIILPFILIVLLVNMARYQFNDYLAFTKTICLAASSFQILHTDIKNFLSNATKRERQMLERYVNRCGLIHMIFSICSILSALAMISGPLVLPQNLPTEAKYPFSVNEHPFREIAYLHQALVGMQCGGNAALDCHMAVLIWFAGARLELLADEFQSVTNLRELNNCIRKHQFLLGKTEEMIRAVRFIILTTTVMTTISLVTGGVHIVSEGPLIVKLQFLAIDGAFMFMVFLSAWPAENLINVCSKVGEGAYNCFWVQSSPETRKNILFVMQRSQAYSYISVAGILPEHSLNYYASFLSKTFSFFTTLRIVIDDSSNES